MIRKQKQIVSDALALRTARAQQFLTIFIIVGIPVVLIVLVVRYILGSDKERRRLRLEVGKLADEVEQARRQVKDRERDNSTSESR